MRPAHWDSESAETDAVLTGTLAAMTDVATYPDTLSFNPGSGLPVITPNFQSITDQTVLDAVFAAAARSSVPLRTSQVPAPPVTPPGGSFYTDASATALIAYAEYAPGTAALGMANGVNVDLACAITVSPTDHNVVIEYHAYFQVQTAGAGSVGVVLYETTVSGAAVARHSTFIGGTFLAGAQSKNVSPPTGKFHLGPTTTERQFALAGVFWQDAGSTLVVYGNFNTQPRRGAWIKAVAE